MSRFKRHLLSFRNMLHHGFPFPLTSTYIYLRGISEFSWMQVFASVLAEIFPFNFQGVSCAICQSRLHCSCNIFELPKISGGDVECATCKLHLTPGPMEC